MMFSYNLNKTVSLYHQNYNLGGRSDILKKLPECYQRIFTFSEFKQCVRGLNFTLLAVSNPFSRPLA